METKSNELEPCKRRGFRVLYLKKYRNIFFSLYLYYCSGGKNSVVGNNASILVEFYYDYFFLFGRKNMLFN